ncbi:MAG: MlaE family ABC transporter permease [Verrucomicrobiales bacterium]
MITLLDKLNASFHEFGRLILMFNETVISIFRRKFAWKDLIYQMHFLGVKSQSVVLITGAFTGMVLAAQTYYQFHKVGMDTATLAVVSVSMCSELGPVLTALMVAGRVGAAMAAELGTMKVTEQIDALRALATHPIDYLIAPRMLAIILAMPLLVGEAIVFGIGAAYMVSVVLLQIDPAYSWANMIKYSSVQSVMTGLIKGACFGAIISTVSCFKGMNCGEGAEGVGKATTEAVVVASISILISNFFLTLFLGRVFTP